MTISEIIHEQRSKIPLIKDLSDGDDKNDI